MLTSFEIDDLVAAHEDRMEVAIILHDEHRFGYHADLANEACPECAPRFLNLEDIVTQPLYGWRCLAEYLDAAWTQQGRLSLAIAKGREQCATASASVMLHEEHRSGYHLASAVFDCNECRAPGVDIVGFADAQ